MTAPRKYPLELRERAVRMYRTADPRPQIKRLATDLGVIAKAGAEAGRGAAAGS
ncbi:hypothetical protein GCM10009730_59570 [Streptomyces albidochromogenes]|uniref:hypothetical protein n=1 Tax=Streptomyces albidochromogenes TaxID=329524 RepID=UPI00142E9FF6|nr:hypothetical protein [Streptomyces albidochromogenes]